VPIAAPPRSTERRAAAQDETARAAEAHIAQAEEADEIPGLPHQPRSQFRRAKAFNHLWVFMQEQLRRRRLATRRVRGPPPKSTILWAQGAGQQRPAGHMSACKVRLATDLGTPVSAAISCCPNPRAAGWSVTTGRGDHQPFSILLLMPALLAAREMAHRGEAPKAHRRPHTVAPAGTPEVSPARGTSASAAAPALQQEQPVATPNDERNQRMPRAPRRPQRRRRPTRLRTSGPTFPVRVVREPIKRVREEDPTDRNGTTSERTDPRKRKSSKNAFAEASDIVGTCRSEIAVGAKHWRMLSVAVGLQQSGSGCGARGMGSALGRAPRPGTVRGGWR
jgi:hypothetical protein